MPDNEVESVVDSFGWIKMHRKIQKSDFWLESGPFDPRSAFLDLLMSASYQKSKVLEHGSKKVIQIEPGQALTSIKRLADRWKWSSTKVSRFLDNLQDMEMITQERTTKYTMITIVNWEKYQGQNEKPNKDTPKPAPQPDSKPEPKPTPQPEANPNKAWEDMTPAEQAAYLRR